MDGHDDDDDVDDDDGDDDDDDDDDDDESMTRVTIEVNQPLLFVQLALICDRWISSQQPH